MGSNLNLQNADYNNVIACTYEKINHISRQNGFITTKNYSGQWFYTVFEHNGIYIGGD